MVVLRERILLQYYVGQNLLIRALVSYIQEAKSVTITASLPVVASNLGFVGLSTLAVTARIPFVKLKMAPSWHSEV